MISKIAVTVAAATGLLLAGASGAAAGSGDYGAGGDTSSVSCFVSCGNTYVYKPNILGGLLELVSPPVAPPMGGGGGGNN